MKVKKLIEKLQKVDPDLEVAILDGFNGGGEPRTINLGPFVTNNNDREFAPYDFADLDSEEDADIVIMGYGCY